MDIIVIRSDFAFHILQKAYEKAGIGTGKVELDTNELQLELELFFSIRDFTVFTVYKTLKASKKNLTNPLPIPVSRTKAPIKTLLYLLRYLTDDLDVPPENELIDKTVARLIHALLNGNNSLRDDSFLTIANVQLELLGAEQYVPILWTNYFVCYYSLGHNPPDAALLCYDAKSASKAAQLTFASRRLQKHTIHSGTVSENVVGIYIQLTHITNGTPSLLSVKPENRTGTLASSAWLEGYYCSALDYGGGGPVAGKLILVQVDTEDAALRIINEGGDKPQIEAFIYRKLINQRLNTAIGSTVTDESIESFAGIYRAYWYLAKSTYQEIRQIRIAIEPNGTVLLTDTDVGHVVGLATKTERTILRLNFDYEEPRGYRLNIAIDVKNESISGYYDGVYSGLRPGTETLMAGKIRLYKDPDFKETDVAGYVIGDALNANDSRQRSFDSLPNGQNLYDYFLGKKKAGSNFIQPTYDIYRQLFSPNKPAGEVDRIVEKWAGAFCLYRLDSRKKRINLYGLTLKPDGTVSYSLTETPTTKPITYSGKALIVNGSLVFRITQKNKNEYVGLFIFRIGGAERDESARFVSGVYATLSARTGAPLCGRAVLVPEKEDSTVYPIEIGSDTYYEVDRATRGLLQRLVGNADNMIEAPTEINQRGRFIPFGAVFFAYTCELAEEYKQISSQNDTSNLDKIRELCLNALRSAIEHGYSNIDKLKEHLERGRLKSISEFVTLQTEQHHTNRHTLTLRFQDDDEPTTLKFRTRKQYRYPL